MGHNPLFLDSLITRHENDSERLEHLLLLRKSDHVRLSTKAQRNRRIFKKIRETEYQETGSLGAQTGL